MMGRHYVGRGTTANTYNMWDVGFPYIQPDEQGHKVVVDVYEVDANVLAGLDMYEGVPSHYTREKTLVRMDNGDCTLGCHIYEAVEPHGERVEPIDGTLDWVASCGMEQW
jgi:gamma-glutamylcyclotransferase (GGCT)/AIG2-like uncharacterized protein YtfP